jgi:hypothetical protein
LSRAQAAVREQEDCLLGLNLRLDSASVFTYQLLERGDGGVDRGRAWMSSRMWRAWSR